MSKLFKQLAAGLSNIMGEPSEHMNRERMRLYQNIGVPI